MEVLLNIFLLFFVYNHCLCNPIQDSLVQMNYQQEPLNIDYDPNNYNSDVEVKNPDDEMMETANSWVFRPMFVYRKMQAQKKRVYAQKRYQNYVPRRNWNQNYYDDYRQPYYNNYYENAKFPTLA